MPSDVRVRTLLGLSLAAPLLFLFRDVLSGDEALYARDVFHQYWPLRTHVVEALRAGHLPLWDDGSQGGMPLLANIHAAALYPPNFIYQLVSFATGYGWLVALHVVALAWGVSALLSASGRASVGAAVAALLFAGSAPVLGLTAFGPNLMGLAWVPWFAHALVRTTGSPVGRFSQGAVLITLQCLCGDPMSVLFSALLVAAILVWSSPQERRQRAVLGLAAAVVGVLIAAVQLWPAAGLLAQTTRAAGGDQLEWSMHPIRFLELVLPKLFGNLDGAPAFWGNFLSLGELKTPYSLSAYVGAGAFALALVGLGQKTRGLGLTLFVVGGVLAMGGQFIAGPMLAHVPPFSLFRYPEKYLALAVLGLCVLAGDGLNALLERRLTRGQSAGLVGLAAVAGLVGGSLSVLAAQWEPWMRATWPGLPVEIPTESFRTGTYGFAAIVLLLAIGGQISQATLRVGALSVLVVGEALWANQALIFTTPVELFTERPAAVDAMLRGAPQRPFRVWRDNVAMAKIQFLTQTPEQRVMQRAWELLTLKSSLATVFGLEELSGNSPVILSRWDAAIRALRGQPGAMLMLYNTCFIIAPVAEGERVFAPMPAGAGVRQVDCLPRLFSVAQTVAVPHLQAALAHLSDPQFPVRTTAVVEQGRSTDTLDPVEVSEVSARSGYLSAHAVAGPRGGFVVLGTSWARGWVVSIDGVETEPRVVDAAVMGTELAPGAHEVVFEFHEPLLARAAFPSVIGVLMLCGAWVGRRRLNRHPLVS